MKNLWVLPAFVAAGHLLMVGALAAPPPGSGMAAPAQADVLRVQATQAPEPFADRMARLRQHRAILQDALRAPGSTGPDAALEPQSRALQPPEPMIATAPPAAELDGEGQGRVSCEAAAQIVADFGFSDIGSPDCSGDLYRFSAMRDGTAYAIGISAATGEIAEVRRQ